MEEIIEVDGIPVLIKERERPPRSIRIKLKTRKIKDMPLSRLPDRHKKALENVAVMGIDKKKQAGTDAGFSESSALKTMGKLLERRPIVKKIEEKCLAKHKKGADEKVAELLVDQLEAEHPLSKEKKPDNFARIKAAQEINKIKDNYPAKKVDIREVGFHLHFTPDDIEAAKQYKELADEGS